MEILSLIGLPDSLTAPVKLMQDGNLQIDYTGNLMLMAPLSDPEFRVQRLIIDGNSQLTADITGFDIIFNAMSDCDHVSDALVNAEKWLDHISTPVINAPRFVLSTARDNTHTLLGEYEGVTLPFTTRVSPCSLNELREDINSLGMDYPLIMRPAGLHNGHGILLIQNEKQLGLAEKFAFDGSEYFLIKHHDFSQQDGLFCKGRLFIVNGELIPRHLIFSGQWNVHGDDRATFMPGNPELQNRERTFLDDPASTFSPGALAFAQELHSRVKLDFFGMDFGLLDNGDIVVFEVNASMNAFHQSDLEKTGFPYLQKQVDLIRNAGKRMVKSKCQITA